MSGLLLAVALLGLAGTPAGTDEARLGTAKALFFDHRYAEAREVWQQVLGGARGADADTAAFWVARCSENLGDHERALEEYATFLDRRPADPALLEEARTSRVGLAVRLYKVGRKQHLSIAQQALSDRSTTVRYYAALQLGGLGPGAGDVAIPVLKTIVLEEKDEDLVNRAKLALLKVDPKALSELEGRERSRGTGPQREASWLRVRIYKKGQAKPEVQINLPVALAEMLFKSLPDDARQELKRKGYAPDTFWGKLKKLGPTQIIDIEGGDGERIQIWTE